MTLPISKPSLLLLVLPILILSVLLLFDADATILGLLSDDAYYYLKIARSIANGYGSSFDGIGMTNGYHPLWMMCMVAIQHLTGNSLFAPLIVSMMFMSVICGLTFFFLYQAVEYREAPGFGALAIAVYLTPSLLGGLTNGLETGVLLLALAFFVWISHRYELLLPTASIRQRFMLGLLFGFIFLCRLDTAFLVLSAGVLILGSGLVSKVPIRALALGCLALVTGVLILAIPFFVWNYVNFGHLSPISGLVKSSFPMLRSSLDLKGDMQFGLILTILDVLLAISSIRFNLRSGRELGSELSSPLSILTAGALSHFIYVFLYMSWGVYWWHFAVGGAAFALGLAKFCRQIEERRKAISPMLRYVIPACIAIAGIGANYAIYANKLGRHHEWYEAAKWARTHTPKDSIFAIKDAGLFGYFSERRVVNLDGKANSYDYLESVNRGDVANYLRRIGVSYIASIKASHAGNQSKIAIPRVNQQSLLLWMPRSDEIYRSNAYSNRLFSLGSPTVEHFSIWPFTNQNPQ